jgi:hypothetical protein
LHEKQKTLGETMEFYYQRFSEKVTSSQKSKNSLKCIYTTREKVKLFLKHQFKRTEMQRRETKPSFAGDFEHFLMTHEKGCSNTAMKYILILKRMLKFAVDQEWLPDALTKSQPAKG